MIFLRIKIIFLLKKKKTIKNFQFHSIFLILNLLIFTNSLDFLPDVLRFLKEKFDMVDVVRFLRECLDPLLFDLDLCELCTL